MSGKSKLKACPRLLEVIKPAVNKIYPNDFKPFLMEHIAQRHKWLSIPSNLPRNIGHVGGERSYLLLGSLCKLERALMKWSLDELVKKYNFQPVIVPNILYDNIIERCGFATSSEHTQVYKISATVEKSILDQAPSQAGGNSTQSCIAGTSEFALASIHIGESIPADALPKKYCALSRCYRAETSKSSSEWGLYRVHYFNKVEMLALTMPDKSIEMHEHFLDIQKHLFKSLNLSIQVLDMPDDDLGESAKKKYDIEAWMPGRQRYGEISSTSNCEEYQASRLNIKYSKTVERDDQLVVDSGFVHTINGTACSSIRTLIALIEQHQTSDGRVKLPDVLVPYMNGNKFIPLEKDAKLLEKVDLYPQPK